MPHPIPFVNLDAQFLSDLAEDFALAGGADYLLATSTPEWAVATASRLRRIARNLESLDSKLHHRPQKSED